MLMHQEYLETGDIMMVADEIGEQNLELIETSANHITETPIRPYQQSRMRMRRNAGQAYLRLPRQNP